jgi:ABC-2 type transport system ATP-binding protein
MTSLDSTPLLLGVAALGGPVLFLAIVVLAALGYGWYRVRRRRQSERRSAEPVRASERLPSSVPPAHGDADLEGATFARESSSWAHFRAKVGAQRVGNGPISVSPAGPSGAVLAEGRLGDGRAVETHGLTKRFGTNVAVDGVELLVPRGCAFGYLGPNGAGKTTLIRTLLGLTSADSGTVSLLGVPVPAERQRALARVGAIVDEPRFHPHLTGRQNLSLLAAARGGDAGARIAPSLGRVGLAERADDKVGTYSMGMRQRLGVAACLLGDPELLLLDEPMNGLDPAGIHEMRALIGSLVDEGRTVMLSSQLLDEVERTCDAVAIVDRGQVVRQGSIDELVRSAGSAALYVDCDEPAKAKELIDDARVAAAVALTDAGISVTLLPGTGRSTIAEVNRRLVSGGIPVYRLQEARASLEDWFLSVTSRLGEPS